MVKEQQLLIELFLNNTLKQCNIQYDSVFLNSNLNSILDQIQQVVKIDKIKILQQLIIATSYNSPLLCVNLLRIYQDKYDFAHNYFNLLLVFKNLYKHIPNHVFELSRIYINSFVPIFCTSNALLSNHDLKYSVIRINNKDDLLYNLKLIFIYLQKLYNKLVNFSISEYDPQDFNSMIKLYHRQNVFIPETLLFLYCQYLNDFNLSKLQYKFFFNIVASLVIKNYQKCLEIATYCNMMEYLVGKDWTMFLNKIFTNWNLLYDKYKQFFKQNGKEMINTIYQASQYIPTGIYTMNENKKNELLNLIKIL